MQCAEGFVLERALAPYSTSRDVLTGLYPHCCSSTTGVVSEPDHWAIVVTCTTGQYDIALATGQYPVYCPGCSFDLRHKWDTRTSNLDHCVKLFTPINIYGIVNFDSVA